MSEADIGRALAALVRSAVAAAFEEERERIRAVVREEIARAAPQVDPEVELWGVARVAKVLGRTTDAIHRAHERGNLGVEAVRVGKRSLRWRAGDVRALAAGKRGR